VERPLSKRVGVERSGQVVVCCGHPAALFAAVNAPRLCAAVESRRLSAVWVTSHTLPRSVFSAKGLIDQRRRPSTQT
jgi:hypothetical protein